MDIKKRNLQSSNKIGLQQNFIEYRPGAFKEASARIKTARVRGGGEQMVNMDEQ